LAESQAFNQDISIFLSRKDVNPFNHSESHKMNFLLIPDLVTTVGHGSNFCDQVQTIKMKKAFSFGFFWTNPSGLIWSYPEGMALP